MQNHQLVSDFRRHFDFVGFHVTVCLQNHEMSGFVVSWFLFLVRDGDGNLGGLFVQVKNSIEFVGVNRIFWLTVIVFAHQVVKQRISEIVFLSATD